MRKTLINFRVSDAERSKLQDAARRGGVSLSDFVRQSIAKTIAAGA